MGGLLETIKPLIYVDKQAKCGGFIEEEGVMKRLLGILGILIFLFLITPIWTNARGGFVGMSTLDASCAPELISPTGETVDITGEILLEFKWFGSFGTIDHF